MRAWDLERFRDGARIRMVSWSPECYIYFDGKNWVNWEGIISNNYQNEFHRDAWVLYEASKTADGHELSPKEIGCIISAYTGILCCPIDDYHKYVEKIMGRSVWTHEFADRDIQKEIKAKSGPDFMRFVRWVHAEEKEETCPRS